MQFQHFSTPLLAVSLLLPAAVAVLPPATAWGAGPAPRLVPTRDVTVDYTLTGRDIAPQALRVSIEAGGRRLRVSAQDLPATFLIDRGRAIATIVVPILRAYTTAEIGRYDPETTVLRHARFTATGAETVAGLACTDWHAVSQDGAADACITPDGVILKGRFSDRHGAAGSVVASVVDYAALDRLAFALPEDYRFIGNLPPGLLGLKP